MHCENLLQIVPTGEIEFIRQVIYDEEFPRFEDSIASMAQVKVLSKGSIEDDAEALQVGMLEVLIL